MFFKLASAIRKSNYAFIIDRYHKNYSLIGFSLDYPINSISSASLNDFFDLIKEYGARENYYSSELGWFGYFSYDLKNQLIPIKSIKKKLSSPIIYFINFPCVFLLNHTTGKLNTISINKKILKKYLKKISKLEDYSYQNYELKLKYLCPFEIYERKIKTIKKEIENGKVYQVNLSHNMIFEFQGDELSCYLKIREKAKPAYGAYFKFNSLHILSFSPERFFKVEEDRIVSSPIKGTMPRAFNFKIDELNKKELKKSIKDKAEHIMIVDLIRNDLGKICEIGSIKVQNLFKIKSYPTVHHIVSDVVGKLKKDITLKDIIEAMFPGGSVTGAPKISAVNLIEELEDYSREIYTGAIGYFIPNKFAEFNIAIRTMIIKDGIANYPVGGGIVYDSDPKKEYEETLTKSKIIF